MARTRTVRGVYLALGMVSLAVALAGTVLPLIPTTGPVLLAGFFFSRSSERFDRWLVSHRLFGPLITDWRAGRGFTVRAKIIAVVAIAVSFAITVVFAVDGLVVRGLLVALAVGVASYVVSRPTKRGVDAVRV